MGGSLAEIVRWGLGGGEAERRSWIFFTATTSSKYKSHLPQGVKFLLLKILFFWLRLGAGQ